MQRVCEALFRRLKSILLVLLVLPVIGVAIALVLPRSYQAEATIWALNRYAVIGATGPESNMLATPAETQATALTELLQTRAFALDVAKSTDLPDTLPSDVHADEQRSDDALFAEISRHVTVGAQGANLFVITYTNTRATIAQQVVAGVIKEFGLQSTGFSAVEGQRLLNAYNSQLDSAQKAVDAAVQAEDQYVKSHPNESRSDLINDAQYAVLHAQTQQAQATLLGLQTKIAQLKSDIAIQAGGPDSLFQVIDAPKTPARPESRMKTFLMAGGGGLALALVACAIYLALLVRRDRGLYSPLDIKRVTALPVLARMPAIAQSAVSVTVRPVISAAVTAAPSGILNGHKASTPAQP